MHALPHLAPTDWLALLAFFACWGGYAWYSEHSNWGASGLIRTSQLYRLEWAYRMLERDVRVTDSTLIGNLVTSVSFYANTTIYIIAGLVAALGASDKLISFTADLPFGKAGEPGIDVYAQRVAGANNLAGDDFNRGIRAYYFGLAASGWLLNPVLLGLLSIVVLVVLFRRDYRSPALHILRD